MKRRLSIFALLAIVSFFLPLRKASLTATPTAPSTQVPQSSPAALSSSSAPVAQPAASSEATDTAPIAAVVPVAQAAENDYPVELIIPSIHLDDPIQPLGVNMKGEMDVPDGRTSNVGWYKDGTFPGDSGSAVLDAHVFAAFKNLKYIKPGTDIYVITKGGAKLHFQAYEAQTYPIASVPLQRLFNGEGDAYLNLITCAGQLTPDHSTYDHRLIVFSKLIP